MRTHGPRHSSETTRDYISDRIEERPATPRAVRWNLALTVFMRILAIFWIMKGLSAWAVILGIWTPVGQFEIRSTGYQATIIYFALIDLIAAVGLWMASTWGGIMWLLAIMSHLILAAFFPGIVQANTAVMIAFVAFIVTYLALSWLAAHEK
ncbi:MULTISPECIES: DUF6163 family protein [Microvirga]|uniref:DUF6163 family protein n=1 Tax=Microvirga TaxID=186650 RepID=UPI001CFFE5E1|nr:DUF6163 family protein [Microvirga lenta]MCB5176860.1 DUF6163 family protein [Microvirga lenta]